MVVEFEEVKYGMLMLVLCDREGRIYDVWISFGSVHEGRAFRERKKRSVWFRGLVENCVLYGDRGYRALESFWLLLYHHGVGTKAILAKLHHPTKL